MIEFIRMPAAEGYDALQSRVGDLTVIEPLQLRHGANQQQESKQERPGWGLVLVERSWIQLVNFVGFTKN